MKKYFLITIISLFLAACGLTKHLPPGSPPRIKEKELIEKVNAAENQFDNLMLKANGKFTNDKGSQSFKVQVRLLRDSLVWIDIADPIIGIKLARAIAFKDSVAFINRIQREYFTGDIKGLQRMINMDLDFSLLQSMIAANIVYPINKDYEVYYAPGAYVLADYDFEESENANFTPMGITHQVNLNPDLNKPELQSLIEGNTDTRYELHFRKLKSIEGMIYPEVIEIIYKKGNSTTSLKLDVKSLTKNTDLKYPFSIPDKYAPIR